MSSGEEPARGHARAGRSAGSGSATIEPSIDSGAGAAGSETERGGDRVAGRERQRVVPGHDRRPAAVEQPADVGEGVRARLSHGVGSSVPCQSNSAR